MSVRPRSLAARRPDSAAGMTLSSLPCSRKTGARSPLPRAPVFLLHGRDDNVIPAAESGRLAARLRGRTDIRLLVTDLVSHADPVEPARVADVLRFGAFWGDVLSR